MVRLLGKHTVGFGTVLIQLFLLRPDTTHATAPVFTDGVVVQPASWDPITAVKTAKMITEAATSLDPGAKLTHKIMPK